ncbi:MAG: leucine-rich repeat domain-containing protein, partial [Bacteroides sp.]|nr:leucine-rich repeat domain-containing protein [Bacteroides sp.]
AKHVTFTKHFNTESGYAEAGGWKTLVLPFDVTETYYVKSNYYNGKTTYDTISIAPFGSNAEGALPYWLYELGTDGNYKAATAIKAHTPYLICMPNNGKYPSEYNISGDVTFAANNEAGVLLSKTEGALKRSVGTKFDLVPTYESLFKNDSIYVLNEDNYYYADDKTYKNGSVFIKNYNDGGDWEPAVDPFQAYLVSKETNVTTASTRGPLYYSIGGGNGEITGIEDTILMPDQAVKVYARGGVLYIESNAARTIHIYNVSGRTVRTIEAQEGLNEVRGLGNGIYLLEGQKVIVK